VMFCLSKGREFQVLYRIFLLLANGIAVVPSLDSLHLSNNNGHKALAMIFGLLLSLCRELSEDTHQMPSLACLDGAFRRRPNPDLVSLLPRRALRT
jgi:hypothetical protein